MICRRSGPFRSSAERPSEKQGTEDAARSELTPLYRIPAIRRHWELFLAYSLKEGQQVIQERVLRRRRVGIVVCVGCSRSTIVTLRLGRSDCLASVRAASITLPPPSAAAKA